MDGHALDPAHEGVCADEDDGYAPFGPQEAEPPADACGAGADGEQSEDGYLDAEGMQAQLIDELVRQLLFARDEMEGLSAALEGRDSQIRYLQQALLSKEADCERLRHKLGDLTQALGSRLQRVSGALQRSGRPSLAPSAATPSAPPTPPRPAQLCELDSNGLALRRAPSPPPAAACPEGAALAVALGAREGEPSAEPTPRTPPPSGRRWPPAEEAAQSSAEAGAASGGSAGRRSRCRSAEPPVAVPRGIIFAGIEPQRTDSAPAHRPPCRAASRPRRPAAKGRRGAAAARLRQERGAPPTPTDALRRAMVGAHGLLSGCPQLGAPPARAEGEGRAPFDGQFAAKLLVAMREAREAEASALAVRTLSRRLSQPVLPKQRAAQFAA